MTQNERTNLHENLKSILKTSLVDDNTEENDTNQEETFNKHRFDLELKRGNKREFIQSLFSNQLLAELFFAWCKDCAEDITVENAKFFRNELVMRDNKDSRNFNFRSLRVGKNFLVAFAGNLTSPTLGRLDLSDNLITDISLHNIKSIISNRKLVSLNLASNMISTEGLKIIHNEVICSKSLSYLNVIRLTLARHFRGFLPPE